MTDQTKRALQQTVSRLRDNLAEIERLIAGVADDASSELTGLLDTVGAAAAAGVAKATWTTYVSLGRAPAADVTVSGRPLWRPETVAAWAATRKSRHD